MSDNQIEDVKKRYSFLGNLLEFFWKGVWLVALTFFLLMFAVMFLQVFARYVLKISFPWTVELARILCIWSTFMGIALAQKSDDHIIVPVVLNVLSVNHRRIIKIISNTINVFISIIVLLGTWMMMQNTSKVLTSTMKMSYSYIYLSLFFGVAVIMILLLRNIYFEIFTDLRNR